MCINEPIKGIGQAELSLNHALRTRGERRGKGVPSRLMRRSDEDIIR